MADVLVEEPPPNDHPLMGRANVILTPHLAGSAQQTQLRAMRFAVTNVGRWAAGEDLMAIVEPAIEVAEEVAADVRSRL